MLNELKNGGKIVRLPKKFLEKMEELFKEDYNDFLDSYNNERTFGLRVNSLKISPDEFIEIFPYELKKIPWTLDGFYYKGDDDITKHPYYYAGLYYVQEPTAMAPISVLRPNEKSSVLDLCAAPGGKTVQIAGFLNNTGTIVANDINFNRLKAVIRNIEKYGIKNAVIINNKEEEISDHFKDYFDYILVDAPCSGEGMFRKDEKMIGNWSVEEVGKYVKMQKNLLLHANKTLKPGGKLVYSTCTFNELENEEQAMNFLKDSEIELVDVEKTNGFSSGIGLGEAVRLLPHKLSGEGHFLSKFKKSGSMDYLEKDKMVTHAPDVFNEFMKEYLVDDIEGYFRVYKDKLYLSPIDPNELTGLNVLRNGWYLGDIKKSRFEPSQSFAMGLEYDDFKNVVNFKHDDINVIKYLKGETLHLEGDNGWNLICVDKFPLGWGKISNGILKNKYAPSWRLI